jgi:hypothetical protein
MIAAMLPRDEIRHTDPLARAWASVRRTQELSEESERLLEEIKERRLERKELLARLNARDHPAAVRERRHLTLVPPTEIG